jgi:hypothetical protein
LFLYSAISTVTAISFKPKATRKRSKKEILSDDFKKRKVFWKIFHLTSLGIRKTPEVTVSHPEGKA